MKNAEAPEIDVRSKTLENGIQLYENYTDEDLLVWSILYKRQIKELQQSACAEFIKGAALVGFEENSIPNFKKINARLSETTGWSIVGVAGIVDDAKFFELLSKKQFPATTWLRTMSQLDYLEEPDMFHDVFAHVPLLTISSFCNFLEKLGHIGLRFLNNPEAIELLSRIYWYTVEFGLIKSDNKPMIYGAGILSSLGETKFCIENKQIHEEFDVEVILEARYQKDKFQSRYFVIDNFEQLYDSAPSVDRVMDLYFGKNMPS